MVLIESWFQRLTGGQSIIVSGMTLYKTQINRYFKLPVNSVNMSYIQCGQKTDKTDHAVWVGLSRYFKHAVGLPSRHPDYQTSRPSGSYWGEVLSPWIMKEKSKKFYNIERAN